ncbi:unnamed protein product, partial [Discosporangium mesarthrocarpum]
AAEGTAFGEADRWERGDGTGRKEMGGSLAFLDRVVGELQGSGGGSQEVECPVCLEEPPIDPVLTVCAHRLCRHCLEDCLKREACCPVCRCAMTATDIIDIKHS